MGFQATPVAREVPIVGSDSVTWTEIIVPNSSSVSAKAAAAFRSKSTAPPTEDRAWCFGERRSSFPIHIWYCRIDKSSPHVVQVLEHVSYQEFPSNGLRLVFPEPLFPFAFLYRDRGLCKLLAVTVSGSAYVVHLKSPSSYNSPSSVLRPNNEVFEFDVRPSLTQGIITSVAAARGSRLVVGTSSGSVTIFWLPTPSVFMPGLRCCELRHNSVVGILRDFVSRPKNKIVAAVQDIGVVDVVDLALVLHSDGTVRVWHLRDGRKLLSYNAHKQHSSEGLVFKRLWVARDSPRFPTFLFAILHKQKLEDTNTRTVSIYSIRYFHGMVWMNSAARNIPLKGECLDVHFTPHHILILKDNGLVSYDIDRKSAKVLEDPKSYALHEQFVADQFFQSFEPFPDDLLWMIETIFTSSKDKSIPLVASILLRKLLYPGIFYDCGRNSATFDGLKKELVSLIEQEVNQGQLSASYRWKGFCKRHFEHWSEKNAPLAVFSDDSLPGGDVVLIRKSSVAVFRLMNGSERLFACEVNNIEKNIRFCSSIDKDSREILAQVLGCVNRVSQKLGKAASAIIIELLSGTSVMKCDDFVPCLRRLLRTEYISTSEKELMYNNNQNPNEFSADMLSSVHHLLDRAVTWSRVLDVVEGCVNLLIPNKTTHKFDTMSPLDTSPSIEAVSMSQIARAMLESAIDVLLFLGFVLDIDGIKTHMSHDDASRIQFKLVPWLQTIIAQWLTIDFSMSVAVESPVVGDFTRRVLSSMRNGSTNKILCKDQLGKGSSESVLLPNCPKLMLQQGLRCRKLFLAAAGELISWTICESTGDGSYISMSHAIELVAALHRSGRHNLAELLVRSTESLPWKQYHSRISQDAEDGGCMLVAERPLAEARGLHGTPEEAKVLPEISLGRPFSGGFLKAPTITAEKTFQKSALN